MRPRLHAALLALALLTQGCASVPRHDPLLAARATTDALGHTLTAMSEKLDEDLFQDVQRRAASCPEEPFALAACRRRALMDASQDQSMRRAEQGFMVSLQRSAARALDAAAQCKTEKCIEAIALEVERGLAEIRALLIRGAQ